MQIRNRDYS